jgi:hypothetical protein
MGEERKETLRVKFSRELNLEFHGTKIISDAGLLSCRKLDKALGLTMITDSELTKNRTGNNTQDGLLALLCQSKYSRLADMRLVCRIQLICNII